MASWNIAGKNILRKKERRASLYGVMSSVEKGDQITDDRNADVYAIMPDNANMSL